MKIVAAGPGAVQFTNAGYGRYTATLVMAGSYVLAAHFGAQLASGGDNNNLLTVGNNKTFTVCISIA